VSRARPLPDDVAAKRSLANLRVAASTSFTADEVHTLSAVLALLRRGGDARMLVRTPVIANVMRKVENMKATLERQKTRRALKDREEDRAEMSTGEASVDRFNEAAESQEGAS
jgi:hypothetical protein